MADDRDAVVAYGIHAVAVYYAYSRCGSDIADVAVAGRRSELDTGMAVARRDRMVVFGGHLAAYAGADSDCNRT